jgi:hypothetical protein
VADSQCRQSCAGDRASLCGAGDRLTVYSHTPTTPTNLDAFGDYSFLYCGSDSPGSRTLADGPYSHGNDMTVGKCVASCAGGGYKYAGLEFGQECFCGNRFTGVEKPLADCSMKCAGDALHLCGAGDRLALYSLRSTASTSTTASSTSATTTSAASATSSSTTCPGTNNVRFIASAANSPSQNLNGLTIKIDSSTPAVGPNAPVAAPIYLGSPPPGASGSYVDAQLYLEPVTNRLRAGRYAIIADGNGLLSALDLVTSVNGGLAVTCTPPQGTGEKLRCSWSLSFPSAPQTEWMVRPASDGSAAIYLKPAGGAVPSGYSPTDMMLGAAPGPSAPEPPPTTFGLIAVKPESTGGGDSGNLVYTLRTPATAALTIGPGYIYYWPAPFHLEDGRLKAGNAYVYARLGQPYGNILLSITPDQPGFAAITTWLVCAPPCARGEKLACSVAGTDMDEFVWGGGSGYTTGIGIAKAGTTTYPSLKPDLRVY